jgi:hypothetical protein
MILITVELSHQRTMPDNKEVTITICDTESPGPITLRTIQPDEVPTVASKLVTYAVELATKRLDKERLMKLVDSLQNARLNQESFRVEFDRYRYSDIDSQELFEATEKAITAIL